MLTNPELHNLLFENRTYFDNQENLSKYSKEELQYIHYLLHELEDYYFKLTLTITDRYEKDDKQTGWKVIRNALFKLENHFDKVYLEELRLSNEIKNEEIKKKIIQMFSLIILIIILGFIKILT
jgi:hypothetical protein